MRMALLLSLGTNEVVYANTTSNKYRRRIYDTIQQQSRHIYDMYH